MIEDDTLAPYDLRQDAHQSDADVSHGQVNDEERHAREGFLARLAIEKQNENDNQIADYSKYEQGAQ